MKFEFVDGKKDRITNILCGRYIGESSTKLINLPLVQVMYLFSGGLGRKGLISIPGVHSSCFGQSRFYARTSHGVAEIRSTILHFDVDKFVAVHQSCVVNLQLWREIDIPARDIYFSPPGQPRECVPISRRRYCDVRKALGFSIREPRRPWGNVPGRNRNTTKLNKAKKKPSHDGVRVHLIPGQPS